MGLADEKTILQKSAAGEKLTDDEVKFVMGSPAEVEDNGNIEDDEEFKDADDANQGDKSGDDDTSTSKKGDDKKEEDETSPSGKGDEKSEEEDEDDSDKAGKAESKEKKEEKHGETETLAERIERELAKPQGQEDLSGFSQKEKGLYFSLKEERRKRHIAEEELDAEKFEHVKTKKAQDDLSKSKEADTEFEELIKELDNEEDSEFVSKSQVKKILEAVKKPQAKKDDDELIDQRRKSFLQNAEIFARTIVEIRREKNGDAPDYDKVMEVGEAIIESNPDYKNQIAKAYMSGKNPALAAYDLIIKDQKFKTLHQPEKKEEESPDRKKEDDARKGKETLSKINKNLKKPATSANVSGGGTTTFTDQKGNTYSASDLLNMSTSEFRKVPREVRKKLLSDY